MAGLRLNRNSQRSRFLAQSIIEQSQSVANNGTKFMLGETLIALNWGVNDNLTDLISGAFWSEEDKAPECVVSILRRGEAQILPSLDWARPWIEAHQILPEELTYPYRIMIDKPQGLIQVFDTVNNIGGIYIRHERELDLRSFITPFRLMWSWIANGFNGEVIHAASVRFKDKGILLSGSSGSGKSTFAMFAALQGNAIIADDCSLVLDMKIYPVFRRSKALADTLALIDSPELSRSLRTHSNDSHHSHLAKSTIDLKDSPLVYTTEANLDAIFFPRISPVNGSFRLNPRQAVERLTSDSLREIHGGGTRNRIRLARLARSLPSYRVLLTPDLNLGLDTVSRIVTHA